MVDIVVLSDTPDGLFLPTLPLYRLATSVTLFCHVNGASETVSYRWSSTSASLFTFNSTSVFNRKTILTSADAGMYTCFVNDPVGNTGQASIEMKFNGECCTLACSQKELLTAYEIDTCISA